MLQLNIYCTIANKNVFWVENKKHISEHSTRSEAKWDLFFTITVIWNMFVIFVINVGVIKFEILKMTVFFTTIYKFFV